MTSDEPAIHGLANSTRQMLVSILTILGRYRSIDLMRRGTHSFKKID